MFKWLAAAFKRDAIPAAPEREAFEDLREAQHLAETFFLSQGNPEEIALVPEDHAKLLGFAVIAGRKMEGMLSGAIKGDVAKEIADYAWEITTACFKACEPQGGASILYKRPDLAQNIDEGLLVPLLSLCVSKGRQVQRGIAH